MIVRTDPSGERKARQAAEVDGQAAQSAPGRTRKSTTRASCKSVEDTMVRTNDNKVSACVSCLRKVGCLDIGHQLQVAWSWYLIAVVIVSVSDAYCLSGTASLIFLCTSAEIPWGAIQIDGLEKFCRRLRRL